MPLLPINWHLAKEEFFPYDDNDLIWKIHVKRGDYEHEDNFREYQHSAHVLFGEGYIWPNTYIPAEGKPIDYHTYVTKAFGQRIVTTNQIQETDYPVCFECACEYKMTEGWLDSPNMRAGAECHICKSRATERYFMPLPERFASINSDVVKATLL